MTTALEIAEVFLSPICIHTPLYDEYGTMSWDILHVQNYLYLRFHSLHLTTKQTAYRGMKEIRVNQITSVSTHSIGECMTLEAAMLSTRTL